MSWHRINIGEAYELLDTRPQGLSTADAEAKLLKYGPNELLEGKMPRQRHARRPYQELL